MLQQNRVTLIGYASSEPEVRATPGGTEVANFRLATSRRWSRADSDEIEESTQFHAVVAWGSHASAVRQFVARGAAVQVEGRLEYRSWKTEDGQTRTATEIVVAGAAGLVNALRPAPQAPAAPAADEPHAA